MRELADSLEEMNSQPIKNLANATPLEAVLGPVKQTNEHMIYGTKIDQIVAGDASVRIR